MKPSSADAALLQIYIGDDDTYQDVPLYDAIVRAARDAGLAGVTVLRGIAGYGRATRLQTFRGFADDLPIVVEIIDSPKKIDAWLGEDRRLAWQPW